jgi:hypothetical protein
MSWEANTWACKQRMKLPQEQLVLIVLGNCADPDGTAFVKWPGRDHWWHYLANLTRLSKSSLFRHINTLVALGLCSRSMVVNADGSRRPTISLDLNATFDIEKEKSRYETAVHSHQRDQSHGETDVDNAPESAETVNDNNSLEAKNQGVESQSHHETGDSSSPTSGNDPVPIVGTHIDSSIPCSKESPPTPSGGFVRDDLWDQFVRAWGEPIPKLALAKSGWDHIETSKRSKAVAGAKGYFAWLRAHPKPPAAISAQAFLRDSGGWEQWLRYVPATDGAAVSISKSYPLASPEGKALVALHEIAGLTQFLHSFMIRNEAVNYLRPISARVLALAQAGPKDSWPILSHQQATAWEKILRDTVTVQVRKHLREGDRAPWPWPPSMEGKIYSTGPPETLMSEQDIADFKY